MLYKNNEEIFYVNNSFFTLFLIIRFLKYVPNILYRFDSYTFHIDNINIFV